MTWEATFIEENLETYVKKKVFIENQTSKSLPGKFYKTRKLNHDYITKRQMCSIRKNLGMIIERLSLP
jgi:hypothetical protein